MTDLAEMPENALPRHQGTLTLIAGYDLGNSGVKFVTSDRKIRFPSYLENCYYRPTELPTEGYVEYLEGDAIT
ncbi:hypothetical protein H6G09_27900, partial [Anabaena sp. FACHB-709]|nr:hypothetical protein [Anabaena sp. FACHB-709]